LELCNGLMQEMLKNRDEHRKDTNERGSWQFKSWSNLEGVIFYIPHQYHNSIMWIFFN
jgi:hypothetical protein